LYFLFFFAATATTEIYTLSLHDALPIFNESISFLRKEARFEHESQEALEQSDYAVEMDHELELEEIQKLIDELPEGYKMVFILRSEEHTSELQSRENLVCRLLLEKKKQE